MKNVRKVFVGIQSIFHGGSYKAEDDCASRSTPGCIGKQEILPVNARSLHEPAVLLHRGRSGFAFLPWPLEAAGLQTLVKEKKAVALPVQRLDPVAFPAAEKKQAVLKGIPYKLPFDQSGQSVNPKPKLRVAAGDKHPFRFSGIPFSRHRARTVIPLPGQAAVFPLHCSSRTCLDIVCRLFSVSTISLYAKCLPCTPRETFGVWNITSQGRGMDKTWGGLTTFTLFAHLSANNQMIFGLDFVHQSQSQ